MQRLCTTLCGLLTSCLCSWGSVHSFSVSQSPSTVILSEGEQLQIICSYNVSNDHRVKVKWIKNNQKLELNRTDKFAVTHINKSCTTLVIKNTEINDEGFYICQVTQDIPRLVNVNGTETKVTFNNKSAEGTVTSTTQSNSPTTPTRSSGSLEAAIGGSASAAAVILSICVCVCVWWMKTRSKQSERVVIREGPPSEGDEREHREDGESSRTSRGSTQWYMVPLYESYFDLQRSDKNQSADSDGSTCAAAQK
ncbi:uncharacterized protein LOC113635039 isoform X1 [Tachysurus ichikawai]